MGEQISRETKRQRGLTDPLRPGEQPGVRQPSTRTRVQQGLFGVFMADQVCGMTWVEVFLALQHRSRFRVHEKDTPRVSETINRTLSETAAISPDASITLQRNGSDFAISRKPFRNRS